MSVLGKQNQGEMCETLESYNLDLEQCFPYGAYVTVGCPDYQLTTQWNARLQPQSTNVGICALHPLITYQKKA